MTKRLVNSWRQARARLTSYDGGLIVQLQNFTGTLRLDDTAHESSLEQSTASGIAFKTLMQLGTDTSDFDAQEVAAAWYHFANLPGVSDGSTIRVRGFAAQGVGSGRPIIHIAADS